MLVNSALCLPLGKKDKLLPNPGLVPQGSDQYRVLMGNKSLVRMILLIEENHMDQGGGSKKKKKTPANPGTKIEFPRTERRPSKPPPQLQQDHDPHTAILQPLPSTGRQEKEI